MNLLDPRGAIDLPASGSGRLALARWLTEGPPRHLAARVMVNRIWQHHFGEGLVRTPNDFGERGERPTNPGLLDFLAARFADASSCECAAVFAGCTDVRSFSARGRSQGELNLGSAGHFCGVASGNLLAGDAACPAR